MEPATQMNDLLRFLELEGGRGTALPLWEAAFAILVSFFCSIIISLTYRATHRTPGYSQSFVHTLALISVVTSVIMVVIGSNIARAFSLVGAMSIIRFRNAVKETRDVGYLFLGIATGMAAGTRFYSLALMATGLICMLLILMERLDFARPKQRPEGLLKVQMPVGSQPETALQSILENLFESYALVTVETVKKGLALEAVYSVTPKAETTSSAVMETISEANENMKVVYHIGAHADPL